MGLNDYIDEQLDAVYASNTWFTGDIMIFQFVTSALLVFLVYFAVMMIHNRIKLKSIYLILLSGLLAMVLRLITLDQFIPECHSCAIAIIRTELAVTAVFFAIAYLFCLSLNTLKNLILRHQTQLESLDDDEDAVA